MKNGIKICSKCGMIKPFNCFRKPKNRTHRSKCILCESDEARERYAKKKSDCCDMCGVSSLESPLVLNPRYFIINSKIVKLAHEGKVICCDCLHDELVVLGGEENK